MKCPVCKSEKGDEILNEANFDIIRCRACDLQFVWPQPDKKTLEKTYSKKYFIGNTQTPKGYADYHQLKTELIKEAEKRIKLIKNYRSPAKNLLDLGCGTGVFLEVAKNNGYKIYGNEISSYLIKILRKKNITCFAGPIGEGIIPQNKFDVVTAWDVVEHIPEIRRAFTEIVGSLKKGGLLFMTTPNTRSVDSTLMGKSWYNYKKAPEHVLFFNNKSISKLLKTSGLKLISIRPWGFYRNISFLIKRFPLPNLISNPLIFILKILRLSDLTFFFPFTDFLIVAKKI